MRHTLFVAILLAAVSVPTWGHADADGTIGVVRNFAGSATVTRGGNVLPATTGTRLHVGDTLGTGPDGSLGVILRDNSSLSLGPSSSLVLRDFLFSPSEGTVRPVGPPLQGDHGLPLGPHRETGAGEGPFRNPDGHHRHPGDPLRREGRRTRIAIKVDAPGYRFCVLGAVLSVGDDVPLPASAGLAPGKAFFIVPIDSWYVAQAGRNNRRSTANPAILRPRVIDIRPLSFRNEISTILRNGPGDFPWQFPIKRHPLPAGGTR